MAEDHQRQSGGVDQFLVSDCVASAPSSIPADAGERVKCRYCLQMRDKSDMKRVPPEKGKTRNVVRMGCSSCVDNIMAMRKRAAAQIKKMLGG